MQWNFVSLFLHLRRNGTAQFDHTRLIPWLSQFPLYDLYPAAKQLLQLSDTQLQTSDCDIDNHHHEDFDTLRDGSSWVGDIPGGSEGFDHDPPWRGWPQQPTSQQGLSVCLGLFVSVCLPCDLCLPIPHSLTAVAWMCMVNPLCWKLAGIKDSLFVFNLEIPRLSWH